MKSIILLFALFLCSQYSVGQRRDSLRDVFIQRFPDHFSVWALTKQRTASFDVFQTRNRGNKLEFKPNNSYGQGFGVYLFELVAEVTFAIPVEEQKVELFGQTKATDLQANIMGRNWLGELFYQRYKGFYMNDFNHPVARNTPSPQRPHVVTDNFGVNGIYVFNKNKYSLRGAYNFVERQRKSAGSFLLTGTLNSYQLKADSAIYNKSQESLYGSDAAITEFNSFTVSVSPGYGYTLVVLKNLFANASVSAGPAIVNINYTSQANPHTKNALEIFADFRLSLGYNSQRFFTGINYVAQTRNVNFDQSTLAANSKTVKLVVGYRFGEVGILKKRAIDLIPFVNK